MAVRKNQPRVPAAPSPNPRGGEWTNTSSSVGSKSPTSSRGDYSNKAAAAAPTAAAPNVEDYDTEPSKSVFWEVRNAVDNANLSPEEKSALYEYKLGDYKRINNSLRSGTTVEATKGRNVKKYGKGIPVEKAIAGMDGVFKKAPPLADPITVVRGFSNDGAKALASLTPGSIFSDKGFISTSSDKRVASDPRFTEGGGFVVAIKVPKGMRVVAGTVDEDEIILPRGTNFRVVGKKGATLVLEALL